MKRLLLTALVGILITTSSFANSEKGITNAIKSNFRADFNNIKDVEWSTTGSYATATFVLDQKRTQAFYEDNGELIGSSHAISIDQLPASAKRTFAKKYMGYTVLEAIQFQTKETVAYYIAAKKDDKTVMLKVESGFISVFK